MTQPTQAPNIHYLEQELYQILAQDQSMLPWLDESALDGIWYWDLKNPDHEWMSPKFWRTLGHDPSEKSHLTSEWQTLINPDDLQTARRNFNQHAENPEQPYDQIVRYIHKDGSTVWVRCRGKIFRDKQGKPHRMLGTHNDLTELMQTQERLMRLTQELQHSNDVLNLALQTANIGVWDWSDQTQTLFWNQQMMEIYGVTPENFSGALNDWLKRLHSEDRYFAEQQMHEALQSGTKFFTEYRIVRPTGEIRHIQSMADVVRNKEGSQQHMVGVNVDITEQKRLAAELNEARVFQELIMENNPDLIVVKNDKCQVVLANQAYLACYPENIRQQIIGQSPTKLYPREDNFDSLAHDRQAFAYGCKTQIESITMPDGEKRHVETSKTRFNNTHHQSFLLSVSRDVTERETLIAELKRSNEELDQFAYIASHDLKEPLRTLKAFSEHLLVDMDNQDEENIREDVAFIQKAAAKMTALVEGLLELSRAGPNPKKTTIDLNKLLENVLLQLAETIHQNNAVVQIPEPLPTVYADELQLERVFQNLINNSIKFSRPDEHPVISITEHPSDDDSMIHLALEDHGIGIDPKFHGIIFSPFKKAHGTEQKTGSGLGLTIVKRIIENHGGSIRVTSEPDQGCRFDINLPKSQ